MNDAGGFWRITRGHIVFIFAKSWYILGRPLREALFEGFDCHLMWKKTVIRGLIVRTSQSLKVWRSHYCWELLGVHSTVWSHVHKVVRRGTATTNPVFLILLYQWVSVMLIIFLIYHIFNSKQFLMLGSFRPRDYESIFDLLFERSNFISFEFRLAINPSSDVFQTRAEKLPLLHVLLVSPCFILIIL
jgi:hypothetical protein